MNPIISGASVVAAGLAIGLAAIGPVSVKVLQLLRLLKVLLVSQKQKEKSVVLFFFLLRSWSL